MVLGIWTNFSSDKIIYKLQVIYMELRMMGFENLF